MTEPLIINNWGLGVGQSPHVGFADIRNCDVKSEPGVLMAGYSTTQKSPTRIASQTFTADAGTDLITVATLLPQYRAVTLTTTGTLPAGLATNTVYYIVSESLTTKLASSLALAEAGTGIDITDAGIGTHSIVTVNMGVPYWVVKSPNNGHYWLLDSAGQLWTSRTDSPTAWFLISGNATKGTGNGMVWWKNYVLVFDATGVSAWGPTTSAFASQGWTNSGNPFLTGFTSATWHSALVGQDDIVYVCNDRYVASLAENTTFVGTDATCNENYQALDLPSGYNTVCLAELGSQLMIGTTNGISADIFPWDRISSSFDLPLRISAFGVKSMVTKGTEVYILAGNEGTLYKTNGSAVSFVAQVPLSVTKLHDNSGSRLDITSYPQCLTEHRRRIFMGIGGTNGSINSSGSGVWSYDTETGSMILEHTISTGSTGGDTGDGSVGVLIGCVFPADDHRLVIGWNDARSSSVSGADSTEEIIRYDGAGEAFAISQLFVVGTKRKPVTYGEVQVDFGRPLASGDTVVIKYRTSTSGTWTTLATFNTADSVSDEADTDGLADITTIQIMAWVYNTLGPGNLSPRLREVRLIPATEQ